MLRHSEPNWNCGADGERWHLHRGAPTGRGAQAVTESGEGGPHPCVSTFHMTLVWERNLEVICEKNSRAPDGTVAGEGSEKTSLCPSQQGHVLLPAPEIGWVASHSLSGSKASQDSRTGCKCTRSFRPSPLPSSCREVCPAPAVRSGSSQATEPPATWTQRMCSLPEMSFSEMKITEPRDALQG